jgi:hypothetical protein
MKRFKSIVASRRFIVAMVVLVALLAVPLVTFAAESEPGDRPQSVAGCEERAAESDLPRLNEFLAELVNDNVVSQEQADEIEARAREKGEYRCIAHLLFPKRSAIGATADSTDTNRREVLRALHNGDSLAGYAAEHGVSEADLVAAIMAGPETKAAELVANGELTQEDADELLTTIETYVNELIHADGIRGFRQTRW